MRHWAVGAARDNPHLLNVYHLQESGIKVQATSQLSVLTLKDTKHPHITCVHFMNGEGRKVFLSGQ